MTLQQLADASGIGKSTLGNYETGRTTMTPGKVSAVAKCLKIKVEELSELNPRAQASEIRERPASYGSGAPICRYPADCDLASRFDKLEAQMQTLTQLLGAALAASAPAAAPDKKKAG